MRQEPSYFRPHSPSKIQVYDCVGLKDENLDRIRFLITMDQANAGIVKQETTSTC